MSQLSSNAQVRLLGCNLIAGWYANMLHARMLVFLSTDLLRQQLEVCTVAKVQQNLHATGNMRNLNNAGCTGSHAIDRHDVLFLKKTVDGGGLPNTYRFMTSSHQYNV